MNIPHVDLYGQVIDRPRRELTLAEIEAICAAQTVRLLVWNDGLCWRVEEQVFDGIEKLRRPKISPNQGIPADISFLGSWNIAVEYAMQHGIEEIVIVNRDGSASVARRDDTALFRVNE